MLEKEDNLVAKWLRGDRRDTISLRLDEHTHRYIDQQAGEGSGKLRKFVR